MTVKYVCLQSSFALTASSTRYIGATCSLNATNGTHTTEYKETVAMAGTIDTFKVTLGTAVTAGSVTLTYRKNGVDTSLSVTISSGTTGSDTSNSFTVAAGDNVSLNVVAAAGTNTITGLTNYSIKVDSTTDKEFMMNQSTTFIYPASTARQFQPIEHGDDWKQSSVGEERACLCPMDATIDDAYITLSSVLGDSGAGTGQMVLTLYKNLATTGKSVTIDDSSTTANITGMAVDAAPGDRFAWASVVTGSTVNRPQVSIGTKCTADTSGEVWIVGQAENTMPNSNGVTEYNIFQKGENWDGTEDEVNAEDFQLKNFYVKLDANIGFGNTLNFYVRKNAGNTSMNVSITGASDNGSDTSNTADYTASDTFNIVTTATKGFLPFTARYGSWACIQRPIPAAGTNFQINIGDAWKSVAGMQINIGDTWKTVAGAQINIGDTWKTIF